MDFVNLKVEAIEPINNDRLLAPLVALVVGLSPELTLVESHKLLLYSLAETGMTTPPAANLENLGVSSYVFLIYQELSLGVVVTVDVAGGGIGI